MKHVIKFDHGDGEKLKNPVLWCGEDSRPFNWFFQDAQHVALDVDGSVSPCKDCIKSIIEELQKEL